MGRGFGVFGDRRPAQPPSESEGGESVGSRPEPDDSGSKPGAAAGGPSEPGSEPATPASQSSAAGIRVIVIGTAMAVAVTAGIAYAATQSSTSTAARAASARHSSPIARGAMHVLAISPASQATGVDGANPIIVTFSRTLAQHSPKPQLTPRVAGSWSVFGNSLIFTPTTPFAPASTVTVQVPAGPAGVRSSAGGLLSTAVTDSFTTGTYSQAALAVVLAELGYLPMAWSPVGNGATRAEAANSDPAAQTPEGMAYDPPAGTFTWDAGYPSTLQSLWSPDQANVLLKGAVMAFESEHSMPVDGTLTPQLWQALFQAEQSGQQNTNGYTYAIASKGSPETLTIWHNGQAVLQSPANTGIGVAPTVDGTFPVFERFLHTIMSGTNPDGSHYSDPVSFVSYFNGGDAVHYFPRPGYGYPQSLGCVELPYNEAEQAYPYLTYGSLVSVVG